MKILEKFNIFGRVHKVVEKDNFRYLLVDDVCYSKANKSAAFTFGYWDDIVSEAVEHCVSLEIENPKILMLGAGCGTITQMIEKILPRAFIHNVEKHKQIIEIARKWFWPVGAWFDMDAETYLTEYNSEFWDVVIVDCYNGAKEIEDVSLILGMACRVLNSSGLVLRNRYENGLNHVEGWTRCAEAGSNNTPLFRSTQ